MVFRSGFSIDSPEAFYNLINGVGAAPPILFPDSHAGEELRYLMEFEKKSNQYAQRLKDVYLAGSNTSAVTYPSTYPYSAPLTSIQILFRVSYDLLPGFLKGVVKHVFLCAVSEVSIHMLTRSKNLTQQWEHMQL